jgi:hypothetical protein
MDLRAGQGSPAVAYVDQAPTALLSGQTMWAVYDAMRADGTLRANPTFRSRQLDSHWSLGKQERHGKTRSPPLGAILRRIGPVARTCLKLHRLLANLHDLADHEVDRHRPLLSVPVVGRLGVEGEGSRFGRGVTYERLQERLAVFVKGVVACTCFQAA